MYSDFQIGSEIFNIMPDGQMGLIDGAKIHFVIQIFDLGWIF